jgi:hypothetical protein
MLQDPMQLAVLARYACTAIPNGNYWLNYNAGLWGYAGDSRPTTKGPQRRVKCTRPRHRLTPGRIGLRIRPEMTLAAQPAPRPRMIVAAITRSTLLLT